MIKVIKSEDQLLINGLPYRYNDESRCWEEVKICDKDGIDVTPKLGTGDDPK